MDEAMNGLAGILAITLSLGIPFCAIIAGVWYSARKDAKEKELRRLVIENNTDPEIVNLVLDEKKKMPGRSTGLLNWGCILLGAGLGALTNSLLGIDDDNDYFWFVIAAGMGLGMLVAFLIGWKINKDVDTPQES